tara:strand:+ start:838 stop:1254 length:417 start_codon:yes stop_codon:yes gene_type:complete
MSFPNYKYGTGLGNVGSYQASGKPYVSGAIDAMQGGAVKITFPAVTRWIYVINHEDSGVRVGFSERGVLNDGNYFQVGASSANGGTQASVRLELKVTELYLSGSENVDVVAGLTGISTERITAISVSGSNWSGSIGIG